MVFYMKKKKGKEPTLASMIMLYQKRGYKRPQGHARAFMRGYRAAQKKL